MQIFSHFCSSLNRTKSIAKNKNNNTEIMKKEFYVAPVMQEFEISSEGVLCSSPAGAGNLGDNSWDLDYDN